jgi:uncharacterized membrane protein YdjX (TVP38/TMEM64 family)
MAASFWTKWRWVLLLFILIGVVLFITYSYNSQLWIRFVRLYDILHNRHELKGFISSFGPYSPIAYILLQVIQVVVAPIPGGAIEFLGGYLFGAKGGFFYSMIGLLLGSWLAFSIARIFKKVAVEKFVSEQTRNKFDYLIEHQGVILSFILFLIPGFPKDALCYILGLTPMHLGIFIFISTVGRIPGTLMATLQGAKAFDHQYRFFLILMGISALVILVFYIYHEEIHQLAKKLKKEKRGEV